MGVDVVVWLKPNRDLKPGEIETLEENIRVRFSSFVDFYDDAPSISPCDSDWPGYLEMSMAERYWGQGYERGNFIGIAALLDYLVRVFPGDVFYGSDMLDMPTTMTWQEEREILWQHFASDGFNGYRDRRSVK
jgi:hypothetical protein